MKEEFTVENIFYVNHARTGLKIFLRAVGKGNKLRIGVQTYNCISVFDAIISSGNTPVFIDISNNFTLDTKKLVEVRDDIDVLIVTHTFGIPANITEIRKIIGEKIIIEDCAHALFSEINKKQVGQYGDASIYSFGYGKYPSIGNGGYLALNNEKFLSDVTDQYNSLENPGLKRELFNLFKVLLYNILHKKIFYKYFTYQVKRKFANLDSKTYNKDTAEMKGFCTDTVRFFLTIINSKHLIKNQFVVGEEIKGRISKQFVSLSLCPETKPNYFCIPLLSIHQKELIKFLNKRGIEAATHFSNSVKIALAYGYIYNSCPVTERIVDEIVTIPCHYNLTKKDIQHIVKSVNSFKS